jgi:hypothetical protein
VLDGFCLYDFNLFQLSVGPVKIAGPVKIVYMVGKPRDREQQRTSFVVQLA